MAPPPPPPPPSSQLDNIPAPKADFSAPPPYEAADYTTGVVTLPVESSKLPTYEEVQLEKSLHGEPIQPMQPQTICAGGRQPHHHTQNATGNVTFIAIADTADAENITSDNSLLGTDIIFVTAFLIAFLFNWIGFLMLTCFCHTIAARYGALSGFGLSLAKWTLIVKHNTDLASHENSWLWWLIMAFGFLICVRALVQYVSIKRTWRLLSASAQERLLFFY